ncbi:MAG: SDR family oxidoreductase [Gammaproteobacteria bacterium]|jgi:NAD(P)-dependent dehydrogenase (short-subunit alcohol dehydrogenase family)|nr:SDR family oxidoreductase [Gammaproteobacteria bacterium]
MGRLQDKVCLITGAAGGQGQVAVDIFLKEGARVLASDRDASGRDALAASLARHPDRLHYVAADVTRSADLDTIVAAAVERFGRIDVLFNNHGAMVGSPILETTEAELDLVLNVNVRASFLLAQKVARQMVAQGGGGSIIHNSSVGGLVGFPDMAAYGASKAGVAQLARSMANDLRQWGIRVNAVAPGAIDTPMPHKYLQKFPNRDEIWRAMEQAHLVGRLGRPEEVIWLVVFLASDEASFMNGAVVTVDGGYSAV